MLNSINVLVIEDSEADYDLILHHLKMMDYEVTSERVNNAVSLKAALEKLEWHVILSDYSLSCFSASEALAILHERKMDIPLIVISGTITEETAIGLMRYGAADYLMKDGLTRLGPLVKKEMHIAQIRRERSETQAALKKSFEWLDLIYNTTSDAMFFLEVESNDIYRCLTVNTAYLASTELSKEQVIGKRADEVLSPQHTQFVLGKYQEAIRAGHAICYEETANLPRGRVTVETTLTPIMDHNGHCTHLLGSSHEITDRKQAEKNLRESENKYRSIAENSFDLIALLDLNGCYRYCNHSFYTILGYCPKELVGRNAFDIIHPDERSELLLHLENILDNKQTIQWISEQRFVNRIRHHDGSYKWVEHHFRILEDEKGVPQQILLNAQDIDKRKQAEEALSESEERNRFLIERLNAGLIIHAPDTGIIYSNPEAQRLLGLSANQMNGKQGVDPEWKFFHEDGTVLPLNEYPVYQIINSSKPITNFICGVYRPYSNDMIWAIVDGYPVFNADQSLSQIVITFIDITERKKAERFLKNLVTMNPVSIQILDTNGFTLEVNPAFKSLFGSVPPADYSIFTDRQLEQKGMGEIFDQLRNGQVVHFPDVSFNPHDSIPAMPDVRNWVRTIGFPICSDNEKPERFVLMQENITERKQAEEKLIISEQYFRSLFEQAAVGVAITDAYSGKFLKINQTFCEILGYTSEELQNVEFKTLTHPDDVQVSLEKMNLLLTGAISKFSMEKRYIRKNGTIVWVELSSASMWEPDEKPTSYVTIAQDITLRKKIEQSLHESEERYHLIDEASQDLIYSYDRQSRFTHANSSMCKLMGLQLDQILGKTHEELGFPPEQCAEWARLHQQVYDTNSTIISETITPIQGGEPQYFEVVLNPIHDPTGAIIGIAGTTRNINARKQAEAKISEQLNELMRWQNATLGREDRILELKREVNKLLAEAGKPPHYTSVSEANHE